MKSRGFISVEVNHPQKGSRRDYLSYEVYDLIHILFVNKIANQMIKAYNSFI